MQQRKALIQATTLDKAALEQLANQRGEDTKLRFIKMAEAEHKAWQLLTTDKSQSHDEKNIRRKCKNVQKSTRSEKQTIMTTK